MTEPQVIEGYLCSCGQTFPDLAAFRRHFVTMGRQEPGQHKSKGRVNMSTGEITMPPYTERTTEQKLESRYSVKKDRPLGDKGGAKSDRTSSQPTDILAQAVQIKFVPRVYTIDYSPILRAAQDAAIKYWGWREDMPLGNFIDTVVYLFFKEKGITLAGYIVEETEEERQEREAAIKTRKTETKTEEEVPV